MNFADLQELHYITPVDNLASIMSHGILSNRLAGRLQHQSVASEEVQERRQKTVPGGRPLHEYVNLYLCARNPMLFRLLKEGHADLCVLRISVDVLYLQGVVVTDANAAADYTRFAPAPDGLSIVDAELTFAEYWTSEDQIEYFRQKSAKCAEVLVPDQVAPQFIVGCYVSCEETKQVLEAAELPISIAVDPRLFFR